MLVALPFLFAPVPPSRAPLPFVPSPLLGPWRGHVYTHYHPLRHAWGYGFTSLPPPPCCSMPLLLQGCYKHTCYGYAADQHPLPREVLNRFRFARP